MARDRAECTLSVSVPNMACAIACPQKVRAVLLGVNGVREADVDYDSRSAVVEAVYPACSEAGYTQMIDGLYALGYQARITSVY